MYIDSGAGWAGRKLRPCLCVYTQQKCFACFLGVELEKTRGINQHTMADIGAGEVALVQLQEDSSHPPTRIKWVAI